MRLYKAVNNIVQKSIILSHIVEFLFAFRRNWIYKYRMLNN